MALRVAVLPSGFHGVTQASFIPLSFSHLKAVNRSVVPIRCLRYSGKTYGIRDRWFTKPQTHILIARKFRQRLGDITQEDVRKEGYTNLTEFQKAWTEIYGNWNPEQIVTAYEFRLIRK